MARLTKSDQIALKAAAWQQSEEMRSPRIVEPTVDARTAYCRWATQAAKFFKGVKPVRFGGDNWKL